MSDYGNAEERKNRPSLKTRKIIRDAQRQRVEGTGGKAVQEVKGRFDPRPPSRPQSPPQTSTRVAELEQELEHLTLVPFT